ncbi:hypothetical protein AV650_08175 [Serratia fonticola]|nr:hypothetical protein AV650_08175 [Serratia fonticola]
MKWTYDASPCVVPSLLMCCALAFSGCAFSADVLGQGRVSMEGAIVETPCAIEVGDRDQSLVMDTLPVSQLIRDGRGPEKDLLFAWWIACWSGLMRQPATGSAFR